MLASTAVRAAVIGDPGVDHRPVAGPDRANLSTHRLHDAGSVGTEDVRVAVFVRQPAHDEEIEVVERRRAQDRKSTRLNSSHGYISYAVFCLKKKTMKIDVSQVAA